MVVLVVFGVLAVVVLGLLILGVLGMLILLVEQIDCGFGGGCSPSFRLR